jgi:hypothetical protein
MTYIKHEGDDVTLHLTDPVHRLDRSSAEGPEESVSRRVIGWLLLLGSPGLAAGITLTLFFALPGLLIPSPWRVDLIFWGAASVASALGGYLVPSAAVREEFRLATGLAGLVLGAWVFFVTMATADFLTTSF